jgi:excisionase family DNA binding protein
MNAEQFAFSRVEAADALRVSLRTVDSLLAQGALRGRRIGRRVVIPKAEIDRLLRRDTPIAHGA